jgi:alkanesulfonate monooxygenase SsuD/methylene tetrahydromethanopterin reductase-like flavin-dependent oxidoreductase (luciferase family)
VTGGRFILGLGAGWMEEEYLAYGYDFPKASVRVAQLDETIQIVRKLWTQTPASVEGEFGPRVAQGVLALTKNETLAKDQSDLSS